MNDARAMPIWAPIYLACKCGAEWDDWQPNNVPVETWCAHVRTYRCPQCGKSGRGILLRRGAISGDTSAPPNAETALRQNEPDAIPVYRPRVREGET